MDQDKIKEGILLAQEGMLLNRINIQTILQLLVEKGIITREEVNQKREYVGCQSVYKNSLDAIHEMQQRNRENMHFSELFEKVLNQTATKDEREYVSKELENYTKYQAQKAKEKYGNDFLNH